MLKEYHHDEPYSTDNILLEVDTELGHALLEAQERNETRLRATVIEILAHTLDHFSAEGTLKLRYGE